MELVLRDNGELENELGETYEVDGVPVTVKDAYTKSRVSEIVSKRLAHAKKNADPDPDAAAKLEELTARNAELEAKLATASETAATALQQQLAGLTTKTAELEAALTSERNERTRDKLTMAILAAAGDTFIDASNDVVPRLLSAHVREPFKDDAGNVVEGQFVDRFRLTSKDGTGKDVVESLTLDSAVKSFAMEPRNAHYVRATGRGGSGGGKYSLTPTNMRRSTMSPADKSKYIDDHGAEAFQALPE